MEHQPMAKASNSLHQASEPFQPISRSAICILARLAAKKAVTEELRNQGVRVTLVRPAEITAKAIEYLPIHPELYDEARERAQRIGMIEKPRRKSAREMQVLLHNRDGAIYWGQLEQSIHELVRSKYER
jgi:hypothetical protein